MSAEPPPAPSAFVRDLAVRQLREYRERAPGRFFAEDHPQLSLADAYAVQDEVARLRVADGDRVAGFKIGCVGPKVVEQFGMSGPIAAILYRSEIHVSGVALPASRYASLAVEGEVAVRIGEDGSIASAFPVIELHNFVFRGVRKTLAELVANNGLNAGIVASPNGEPAAPDADWPLSVSVNGLEVDYGSPWAMPGGAEESVGWLRRHLAERGRALSAGHIVLTGTPLGLHRARPGDLVRVAWGASGAVEARVLGVSIDGAYDRPPERSNG